MVHNRQANQKRKFLSKGGRLTLIKSTLSNLPIYYLSVLNIPSNVPKKLEIIQCYFLWGDNDNTKRFHLVKLADVKKPIKEGGLGLRPLSTLNKALLGKWIWRFWKNVIDCKWFNGNRHDLSWIKNSNYGLSLWKCIMNLNNNILQCSKWTLGKGNKIRLWEDIWWSEENFQSKFPLIHVITRNKNCLSWWYVQLWKSWWVECQCFQKF